MYKSGRKGSVEFDFVQHAARRQVFQAFKGSLGKHPYCVFCLECLAVA